MARRQASVGADTLPGNPRPWGRHRKPESPQQESDSNLPWALLLGQITEIGLTVNGVARDVGLPATRLHEIVHERRGISAETAIALGAYFLQTPEFWMNAQTTHELSRELAQNGPAIRSRIRPHAADRAAT